MAIRTKRLTSGWICTVDTSRRESRSGHESGQIAMSRHTNGHILPTTDKSIERLLQLVTGWPWIGILALYCCNYSLVLLVWKLFSYCIRHGTVATPRREPQVTRYTFSCRYYGENICATPQVKLSERDQALREEYAYIKQSWLWRMAAHYAHAEVISGCRRPNTP